MKAQYSIAIVDDSRKFGEWLRETIKHEIHVDITLYCSGEEFLSQIKRGSRFNLYILDYQLDRAHHRLWGDEVYGELVTLIKDPKVIFIATQPSILMLTNKQGVVCLPREVPGKQLIQTIKSLLGIK